MRSISKPSHFATAKSRAAPVSSDVLIFISPPISLSFDVNYWLWVGKYFYKITLKSHHFVNILVSTFRFIQSFLCNFCSNPFHVFLEVFDIQNFVCLSAAHYPTSAMRRGEKRIWISFSTDDERTIFHVTRNYSEHSLFSMSSPFTSHPIS